jgi:hypothetical protein
MISYKNYKNITNMLITNYNLTFENNNVIKLMYAFVPIFMVNAIFEWLILLKFYYNKLNFLMKIIPY